MRISTPSMCKLWSRAALLSVTCLLLTVGCRVLPSLEVHVVDEEGKPVAGVPVVAISSEHVRLSGDFPNPDPDEVYVIPEEELHCVEGYDIIKLAVKKQGWWMIGR